MDAAVGVAGAEGVAVAARRVACWRCWRDQRSDRLLWEPGPNGELQVAGLPDAHLVIELLGDTGHHVLSVDWGEYGRVSVAHGRLPALHTKAIEFAQYGANCGPPLQTPTITWHALGGDTSRRAAAPQGELRIVQLDADRSALLHIPHGRPMCLLGVDRPDALQAAALDLLAAHPGRPVAFRAGDTMLHFRGGGPVGVLGQSPLPDGTVVLLVDLGVDSYGVVHVCETHATLLARCDSDALWSGAVLETGEGLPLLLHNVEAHEGDLNTAINTPPPPRPRLRIVPAEEPEVGAPPECVAVFGRYLERVVRPRLAKRGAVKAREMLTIFPAVAARCSRDLCGRRVPVHAEVERLAGRELIGGARNIRDGLALLHRAFPEFVRADAEGRHTLAFASLSTADASLVQRMHAALDMLAEDGASADPITPDPSEEPDGLHQVAQQVADHADESVVQPVAACSVGSPDKVSQQQPVDPAPVTTAPVAMEQPPVHVVVPRIAPAEPTRIAAGNFWPPAPPQVFVHLAGRGSAFSPRYVTPNGPSRFDGPTDLLDPPHDGDDSPSGTARGPPGPLRGRG